MPLTTPFHARLAPLNEPQVWEHWSGYLAAPRYQYSAVSEYYATRNAVALFDTSPLFKYRFSGPGAETFLARVLARDVRHCRVGQAQYTFWCNPAGYVIEDGVLFRTGANTYWLSAAEPNLRYFSQQVQGEAVEISDVSRDFGILAVQGPHSITVLRQLTDAVNQLDYFEVVETAVAGHPVILSRTGYTGDLGYEIWAPAAAAEDVWDALAAAGKNYNVKPLGLQGLMMARIEAGLLLLDVDFHSARYAWVDAQRETPLELGWRWMLRRLAEDNRPFIGRAAIEAEMANRTSRWATVGLAVDWHDYERVHRAAGIMPPKEGVLSRETMSIYDTANQYAGYATSYVYSSLLKRHIALAKLPPSLAKPGTAVQLEHVVIRRPVNIKAEVVALPFYNPARKTAPADTLTPTGRGR